MLPWRAFALFLLLTACSAPASIPLDIAISETAIEKVGLAANTISIQVTVSNRNSQAAAIHWDRTDYQSVVGWTCELNGDASNSGVLNIPANSSTNVILSALPSGNAGVAIGTIEFYDPAHQQVSSKNVNYQITALTEYFRLSLANPANITESISNLYLYVDYYDHHVWLVNDNNIPVVAQWARKAESPIPTGWQLSAKTHLICYPSSSMFHELGTIPPMDSIPFKLIHSHYRNTGYVRASPIFWVAEDSINSVKQQPFTYELIP